MGCRAGMWCKCLVCWLGVPGGCFYRPACGLLCTSGSMPHLQRQNKIWKDCHAAALSLYNMRSSIKAGMALGLCLPDTFYTKMDIHTKSDTPQGPGRIPRTCHLKCVLLKSFMLLGSIILRPLYSLCLSWKLVCMLYASLNPLLIKDRNTLEHEQVGWLVANEEPYWIVLRGFGHKKMARLVFDFGYTEKFQIILL